MLTAPAVCLRRVSYAWRLCAPTPRRQYGNGRRAGDGDERRTGRRTTAKKETATTYTPPGETTAPKKTTPPPLIEQLFPERYATTKAQPQPTREVPKIPATPITPPRDEQTQWRTPQEGPHLSRKEQLKRTMAAQPPDTSVLVLRNAGKSLLEEDFRRVIPQGKHLEGWTLEQGDILRVIPGRDLETLQPTGDYYLLFSSPLSAFMYQGHVSRIHSMVTSHAPSSLLSSPIAPPKGYMQEGMDVKDAINSFTLLPPDQRLQLRQLKPPLAPTVQSLVRHGGYEQLMQRKDRMPHEAKLTLEGSQLQLPFIRHILRTSGKDRGLYWSGHNDGEELPKISQWEPVPYGDLPSPSDHSASALTWQENTDKRGYAPSVKHMKFSDNEAPKPADDTERRTPRPVYIVGFSTERAMQDFVHFWHRRPMAWPGANAGPGGGGQDEGDGPPLSMVEVLW